MVAAFTNKTAELYYFLLCQSKKSKIKNGTLARIRKKLKHLNTIGVRNSNPFGFQIVKHVKIMVPTIQKQNNSKWL